MTFTPNLMASVEPQTYSGLRMLASEHHDLCCCHARLPKRDKNIQKLECL